VSSSSDEQIIEQKFIVMSNDDDPDNYDTEKIFLNNEQLINDLISNNRGKNVRMKDTNKNLFDGILVPNTKSNMQQLEYILEKTDGYTIEEILDGYIIATRLGLPEDSNTLKNFLNKLNIFPYEALIAHYINHEKYQLNFLKSLLVEKYIENPFNIKVSSSLGKTIIPKKLKTAYCIEMMPFISMFKWVTTLLLGMQSSTKSLQNHYQEFLEQHIEHKLYKNYLGTNLTKKKDDFSTLLTVTSSMTIATTVAFSLKYYPALGLNLFSFIGTKMLILPLFTLFQKSSNHEEERLIYDHNYQVDEEFFKSNPIKTASDLSFNSSFLSCGLQGFSQPAPQDNWNGIIMYYENDQMKGLLMGKTLVLYRLTDTLYILGEYIVQNDAPVVTKLWLGKKQSNNLIEKEFCLYKPIDDLLSSKIVNIMPSEYDFNIPITYCALKKDYEDKLTLYVETEREKVKIPLHYKCFSYIEPNQIKKTKLFSNILYILVSMAAIIGAHKISLFTLYINGIKSIYNSLQSTRTSLVNKYKSWYKTREATN
jgi:hypothetical protein